MLKFVRILVCFLIVQLAVTNVLAQNYGLGFRGNETDQDKRTQLDLSAESSLCFKDDFELSFDLAFLPNTDEYFGYVFRIITDDNQNIDLIYDKQASKGKHFNVIIGNRVSNIQFDIPDKKLISEWTRIKLKFNIHEGRISINCNGIVLTESFKSVKPGCYKVLFGSNDYPKFQAIDVPPMKLRDIRIMQGNKLEYSWPLNDDTGEIAKEVVHNKNGAIINPLWIKNMHAQWKLLKTFSINGAGSVAFEPKNEILYFVGIDTIMRYYVQLGRFNGMWTNRAHIKKTDIYNQSVFDPANQRIYTVFPEERLFTFDLSKSSWTDVNGNVGSRSYSQYNKFYSPLDSSIYVLGGYGHYVFKSEVLNYHIPTGKWQKTENKGDFFTPRHLAGLGATSTGAYILGGYGSTSGQQILNPMSLYDLMFFNVKTKEFKKIYELKHPEEDFAFANSLVIDESKKTYYGAIFPKNKASTGLQLISGSLTKPVYETLGSVVPYEIVKDIHSYADLFYCKISKEFIIVTLFHDDKAKSTRVCIYALYASPIKADAAGLASAGGSSNLVYYVFIVLILGLAVLIWFLYKRAPGKTNRSSTGVNVNADTQNKPIIKNTDIRPTITGPEVEDTEQKASGAIYLFGGLQMLDIEGNDQTKQLTPLLKEIFLAILLYTIKWKRGISTEKLNELFWFDKSGDSANNNRSVNIAKLKQFLDKLKYATITKDSDYWKINIDYSQAQVDYKQFLDIVKDKSVASRQKVSNLASIIHRGGFLSNASYEWIDNFKLETANEIIDAYLHYANAINIADDPEFLIEVANYIFYFDPVNEEAMQIKCKALVLLGKHSLAKYAFENFCQEYKAIYKENFNKDFQSILE